jgi:hypothetical protein
MVRVGALLVTIALEICCLAHEVRYPKRDRLELSATRAKLTIEYVVPPVDAPALKQIFRDRDMTSYLVEQALHFVALSADGKNLAMHIDNTESFDLGVRVEMSAAIDRPHRVKLEDRHKDRRVNVPVEVILDQLQLRNSLDPQPFVFADHPLIIDLK